MKKDYLEKAYAISLFVSMTLPFFALDPDRDCNDDCYYIMSNFRTGMCVREAIDELYWGIAFIWFFVIYGSCMILHHKKKALSPFVIIGMIIALSIWGAFVDPSKWKFVLSLIPSVVLFIIGFIYDNRNK